MISYKGQSSYVILWILCLIVVVVPGVVSDVALTSNLPTTQPICPGETIVFTCTTTGSSRHLWTSDVYIGVGSQLEFRIFDRIGTIRSSADVIANLTDINGDILTSTLHIVITPTLPSSTITCINGGLGTTNTSTVQVAAVPGVPRNVMAVRSMEDCMIQVTWVPPAGAGVSDYTYRIDIPSQNITASNISSTESTLHVPNCADGISVQVYAINGDGCMMSSETLLHLQNESTTTAPNGLPAGTVVSIVTIAVTSVILLLCVTWIGVVVLRARRVRKNDRKIFKKKLIRAIGETGSASTTVTTTAPLVQTLACELLKLMKKMPPRDIKEVLMTVLDTEVTSANSIKDVLRQLNLRVLPVVTYFDNQLGLAHASITMDSLRKGNNHQQHRDELIKQVNKAKPETVKDNLQKLFKALLEDKSVQSPSKSSIQDSRESTKQPEGSKSDIPMDNLQGRDTGVTGLPLPGAAI